MTKRLFIFLMGIALLSLLAVSERLAAEAADAGAIVEAGMEYYRGNASVATVEMTIHRPDWERKMTIRGWTKGRAESLFTIIEPPKDKGNGTLKRGSEMWTFNPKINRVIKLPPSMMSQAWMGSDFSNNDLAKSDSIINDYTHTIEGSETHEGKRVWQIKSVPKQGAPVVWGMQRLKIREDHILLEQHFYDEDKARVKSLVSDDIRMMDGKLFPKIWKMQNADAADEYTVLNYQSIEFKEDLPDSRFTLSALKTLIH